MSKRIDIAWMIRKRLAIPGRMIAGTLSWDIGGDPAGSISYTADMKDLDAAELRLAYSRGEGNEREHVKQTVRLTYSEPNFGGRRWWMICPFRHNRCGKLYLPNWGDRFAGRLAWRLGYRSQRVAHRDRPFERLSTLRRSSAATKAGKPGFIDRRGCTIARSNGTLLATGSWITNAGPR